MTTARQLPGKIFLILAIQCMIIHSTIAQNQTESEPLTFAPLPEALVSNHGTAIESSEQWKEIRREEILELFRDHVYGNAPQAKVNISQEVKLLDRNALDGSAVQKEVAVHVSNGPDTLTFTILIYLPVDLTGPVPLFLGLNFYGNHTIHSDEQISLTDSWIRNNETFGILENRAVPGSRGVRAHRWPVELILSRGYGLATIYYGDIDPDFDDGFRNGIHRLFPENGSERDPEAWGSIAAWAWGLSRAMDYFETDPDVDHGRVAVLGHSRLGKTSLWAGAQDERFSLVISNNSGCGGAALSRRAYGERVTDINSSFPHWFASGFHDYSDNEAELPVDQHMLVALMAPRPLYVASAEDDLWADPHGEYLSLFYAGGVYGLYGEKVMENDQLPETDHPLWSGKLGYHIRTGKHDLTRYDWEQYLNFADQYFSVN
ncbi:MAG: acetylxylan esterase [Bacteroidales bacterium]|nr:acetylxylan esterase [Bacteroidales bacterium]